MESLLTTTTNKGNFQRGVRITFEIFSLLAVRNIASLVIPHRETVCALSVPRAKHLGDPFETTM